MIGGPGGTFSMDTLIPPLHKIFTDDGGTTSINNPGSLPITYPEHGDFDKNL